MKSRNLLTGSLVAIALFSSLSGHSQAITDTGDKVGIGILVPKEKLSLPVNTEIGFAYSSGQNSQVRLKGGDSGMTFTSAYTTTQTEQAFAFFTMNNTPTEVQRLTILNNGKLGFSSDRKSTRLNSSHSQ